MFEQILIASQPGIRIELPSITGGDCAGLLILFRIPPGGVLQLDYRTNRESWTFGGNRRYDLKFRDETGAKETIGLVISAPDLLTLARYLHWHSPEVRISD